MWVDDYHWHYDYARLAWDTGFCFDKYKYPNLDKNKICLIDIDRIIKERDVASVDRNISTVVQYILENDQAEVLDINFVKLFRLSQLSVEYLLFCKKYLDRTVVLLKKELIKLREEVKELKLYTEELETHISSSRNISLVTYKCEICSKIFSSEDYLNSHLKRRHNAEENKCTSNSEAEKLHTEIKQLKERLNNTEKFIHEKPCEKERDIYSIHQVKELGKDDDKTTKLVSEIQDSFEKFRKQVEDKMTNLQSEKSFFTDKYDKLFDIVLQYKNKEQEIPKAGEKKINDITTIENTTQTVENNDKKIQTKNLQMFTVQHENICSFNKENEHINIEENIDEKINKKLSCFEENIENKISSGLFSIENQIQAFWEKISEVEIAQPAPIAKIGDHSTDIQEQHNVSLSSPENKPKIKPRTKLTQTATIRSKHNTAERVKNELDQILSKAKPPAKFESKSDIELQSKPSVKFETKSNVQPTVVKSATSKMYETTSDDDSVEDEQDDSNSSENLNVDEKRFKHVGISSSIRNKDINTQKPETKSSDHRKTLEKQITFSSNKQNSPIENKRQTLNTSISKKVTSRDVEKIKQKLRKQLNDIVDLSLQEMGISPHWQGIPEKTFRRALEIVNHQAALNKKSLPEYDSLKKSIKKSLKFNNELKKGRSIVTTSKSHNVMKFQISKKPLPESKSEPAVTIKNRSLYDTESETDIKTYLPKTIYQDKDHGAVIEELQSKFLEKLQDTDSDLQSAILSNDDKGCKETKSALKNYSSEGALMKKKVLFNVEDVDKREEGEDMNIAKESSLSDFEIT